MAGAERDRDAERDRARGDGPGAALLADMKAKGIDAGLSLSILDDYNAGLYDSSGPVVATGVPAVDGRSVVSLSAPAGRGPGAPAGFSYAVPARAARERLDELGIPLPPSARDGKKDTLAFDTQALERIGEALLGRTAFGVLNGGSATSYADSKKNLAFGQGVFDALAPSYERLAPLCKDEPKGLTPAYLEPDGSPGSELPPPQDEGALGLRPPRPKSGAKSSTARSCRSFR